MTTRTFVTFAILAALCLNIVSTQTLDCTCDWLETNINTINNLYTSSFQISSINLNTYYIPSYINSACGNIGVAAQVEDSSSSEGRKVSRKGKAFTLAADEPSFLELTQTVTATEVTNALVFDAICIQEFGFNPNVISQDEAYCTNPLSAYFKGNNFPNNKGKDNANDRQYYLGEAFTWYTNTVYDQLNCTF
jgi:hypothetical protein